MSTAEQIFEQARKLSPSLQMEALDFIKFLAERHEPIDPQDARFTSELIAAFAEAKAEALRSPVKAELC